MNTSQDHNSTLVGVEVTTTLAVDTITVAMIVITVVAQATSKLLSAKTSTMVLKTTLSLIINVGNCRYGDNCSFAHGEHELRKGSAPQNSGYGY